VLVRRDGYGVACEAIDAAPATAPARLLAGDALGDVSARFAAWMAAGMIARIEG
jgi:hypothetical protein